MNMRTAMLLSRAVASRPIIPELEEWLSVDAAKLAGSVADLPRRDQMPLDLNEQLVVEYYSR